VAASGMPDALFVTLRYKIMNDGRKGPKARLSRNKMLALAKHMQLYVAALRGKIRAAKLCFGFEIKSYANPNELACFILGFG
jgi:hypothetical protein